MKASKPKNVKEEDEKSDKKDGLETCCCHPMGRRGFRFIEVDMDIPLPPDAKEDEIKSAMANGVLKIKIVKKSPQPIDIENN